MTWLKDLSLAWFQSSHTSFKVPHMCLTWVGEAFDSEIRLLGISESKCATITKLHTADSNWTNNRAGDEAYVNFTNYSNKSKLYSGDAQFISQPEHSALHPDRFFVVLLNPQHLHLGLAKGWFPSCFTTENLHALLPHTRCISTHLSLLTDLTILPHIKQNYCIYTVCKIHGLFFQCNVALLPLRQACIKLFYNSFIIYMVCI